MWILMYAFLACAFKTNDYTLSVGMCFNENKTAMYVFQFMHTLRKKSGYRLSRFTPPKNKAAIRFLDVLE